MNTITATSTVMVLTSAPRPRYVYEGAKRTDELAIDEATGQPQWQARGLIQLELLGVLEGTLRLPQSVVTEELAAGVVVTATGEPLRIGLRGGDYGTIVATVEGVSGFQAHGTFVTLATVTRPLKAAANG